MSFPASPTINQTTTTNGITYVYNTSSNNVGYWTRVPTTLTLTTATGSATRSTTTSTPPAGALVGDIWYYQGTDAVYRYEFDGFTTTWIDFNGPTVILSTGTSVGVSGGTTFTGGTVANYTTFQSTTSFLNTVTITGALLPGANITYDLGSTSTRWRTLYVSSSTIDLGGTALSIVNGQLSVGGSPVGSSSGASSTGTTSTSFFIGGASTGTFTSVGLMINTTDAVLLPGGTTAQRPATPINGMFRYNSSNTSIEAYLNSWITVASANYSISYLIVGGGGGGGTDAAGGGGAGGMIVGSMALVSGNIYTVTVGNGGAPNTTGTNSVFNGITALGGGCGGNDNQSGGPGGSGGGSGYQGSGGSGTAGQGNAGGSGNNNTGYYGAGGGGAGGAGSNAPGAAPGGSGSSSTISGSVLYYAGGGGGGFGGSPSGGAGAGGIGNPSGTGGGGNGHVGGNGTTNAGGGGGGGGGTAAGGNGGSGVVILSYTSLTQKGTGGVVTSYTISSVTYFVHTFTSSATFTA